MSISDLRYVKQDGKMILQFKESYTEYFGGSPSEYETDWQNVRVEQQHTDEAKSE